MPNASHAEHLDLSSRTKEHHLCTNPSFMHATHVPPLSLFATPASHCLYKGVALNRGIPTQIPKFHSVKLLRTDDRSKSPLTPYQHVPDRLRYLQDCTTISLLRCHTCTTLTPATTVLAPQCLHSLQASGSNYPRSTASLSDDLPITRSSTPPSLPHLARLILLILCSQTPLSMPQCHPRVHQ